MDTRDDFRDPGAAGRPGQGGGMGQGLKEEARGVAARARETSGRLAGRAWDQADQAVRGRKDTAAQQLDALSGALRDGAQRLSGEGPEEPLGRYASRAADGVERAARYLREHDPEDLVREVEGFARRRPELFVGSAFVTGILLARFLKSSSERRMRQTGPGGDEPAYGEGLSTATPGAHGSEAGYGGVARDASPDDFGSGTGPGSTRVGG